jgi:CBS domain-containing protein
MSAGLTTMVYAAEDAFHRLPIHWMWWPAIGGLVVGVGGYIFPEALGVGYDVIETMIRGDATTRLILGVIIVKSIIWAVALGSGTSGGVLAPLLMMGGALGGLEARFLPNEGAGFWPLISMAAILGGTMRAPLSGIVFTLELTHDINMLLPLLCATAVAHGFTVLIMKRSILTEKIDRRGFHISREYAVDPLEVLFVREVMLTEVVALPADMLLDDAANPTQLHGDRHGFGQGLYPVVDQDKQLIGVVTRSDLRSHVPNSAVNGHVLAVKEIIHTRPVVAYADEPLRQVIERMAESGRTRLPVVMRSDPRQLVGMISLADFLRARQRNLEEERPRERTLTIRFPVAGANQKRLRNGKSTTTIKSRGR